MYPLDTIPMLEAFALYEQVGVSYCYWRTPYVVTSLGYCMTPHFFTKWIDIINREPHLVCCTEVDLVGNRALAELMLRRDSYEPPIITNLPVLKMWSIRHRAPTSGSIPRTFGIMQLDMRSVGRRVIPYHQTRLQGCFI